MCPALLLRISYRMRTPQDPQSEAAINAFALALDGYRIKSAGGDWVARLQGIHPHEHNWWFQITADGYPEPTLLVRAPRDVRVDCLMCLVQQWQPSGAPFQTILSTATAFCEVGHNNQLIH
jgi:hypothetical protein